MFTGEGLNCYVEEPLIEIANDYNNVIQNHKCFPKEGDDIFNISKHSIPSYIKGIESGNPDLLHYQISIPQELSSANKFSIVIDKRKNRILTGEEFAKSYGDLPNLISKDPSYLENTFQRLLEENPPTLHYKTCSW